MDLRESLDRVMADLRAALAEQVRWNARIRGLQAERDALLESLTDEVDHHSAIRPELDLSHFTKDRAILAVLQDAPGPLGPKEIVAALHIRGRPSESYTTVSVYLNNLLQDGRVVRVRRGLYEVGESA